MKIHRDQLEMLIVLGCVVGLSVVVFYFRQIKEVVGAIFGILRELMANRREQESRGGPACGDEP